MNSRERVLSAINHVEPEGLPVDLGSTPSSGISAIAYDRLIHHIPLKDKRNWVYGILSGIDIKSKISALGNKQNHIGDSPEEMIDNLKQTIRRLEIVDG